jgi:hypothetical protein
MAPAPWQKLAYSNAQAPYSGADSFFFETNNNDDVAD